MDLQLAGRRVLITGASQGIGAGIAEAFAREGASLTLVARSEDKLQQLAEDLRQRFGVPVGILAEDLTAPGAVDRVAAQAPDTDILVNNAGVIPGGDLFEVDAQRWREGWELKVMGYIDMTRAFYGLMRARGGGVIINNIGSGGENFDFDYVAGCTGNAALMAFTRSVGGRGLKDGVRVLGVNPGPVATDRIERILRGRAAKSLGNAERAAELKASMPLGRAASVEEVADLIVFLASGRSAYTAGTIVTVDGGAASAGSII
ncbi:SDR family oxidoreductase [Castellaniella sp.]|uniref:SDR family oxidoreductase n=1 Tax=Castellaniella sp. TaxID=1955812 RepID=UPI0035649089